MNPCVCVIFIVFLCVEGAPQDKKSKVEELLWNLTNYALQRHQTVIPYADKHARHQGRPQISSKNKYSYQQYSERYPYQNYLSNSGQQFQQHYAVPQTSSPQQQSYQGYDDASYQNYAGPYYRPSYYNYPRPKPYRESFMDALQSIAINDELHCVPRLLCEVTSGTLAGRQLGLPFNVDMSSAIGLLSSFSGIESNPILSFGKAALLGYSSKGDSTSCVNSYPLCPKDPDRLVTYLNNHNGGFFRFFQGVQPHVHPSYAPSYNQQYGYYKNTPIEQRIQNKPGLILNHGNYAADYGFKFPEVSSNEIYNSYEHTIRSGKSLKFPGEGNYREDDFRKPKELPYTISDYYNDNLRFERPSPGHKASPMIFPDRTGTGDLRLDPEELFHYRRPAFENNNIISFNSDHTNDAFYPDFNANSFRAPSQRPGKSLFTFPL